MTAGWIVCDACACLLVLVFHTGLEHDLITHQESPSMRIYLALLRSNRPEEEHADSREAANDARYLYDTRAHWSTEGSSLTRLLCTRR